MKTVRWLDAALEDLRDIGRFTATDNPAVAYRILLEIKASADLLSTHPEAGRRGRVKGTRELVLPRLPYILPYRIAKNDVQILAVMHTSRKFPETF